MLPWLISQLKTNTAYAAADVIKIKGATLHNSIIRALIASWFVKL